jgi:hypothetical protein
MHEMLRRFYGYGPWEVPYWFIRPAPGMARSENNDLRPQAQSVTRPR